MLEPRAGVLPVSTDGESMTVLEAAFPYVQVSQLVAADRRAPDPAYQAHRWWARRPPALVRAALLAAALPAATSPADFWRDYASPAMPLAGRSVLDPFLGGGTTLVEAARLGARALGSDVDPLAVAVSRHQLAPADGDAVAAAGQRLIQALTRDVGAFWPPMVDADGSWTPLHYFTAPRVTCPACEHEGLLYRSLVLARSVGRAGSVVRTAPVVAFCPICCRPQNLAADASTLTCCDEQPDLTVGTYVRSRYSCAACGAKSSHEQLRTGAAPRVLIAVEETPNADAGIVLDDASQAAQVEPRRSTALGSSRRRYRRIRAPLDQDEAAETAAQEWLLTTGVRVPATTALVPASDDPRPGSFGVATVGLLHTARQMAYLGHARRLLDAADEPDAVKRALALAISGTITSNNRLCGYATDYGRLAPLFSVRAYSLPALAVELNPLNSAGGRGTLRAALARVARSCSDTTRRSVFDSQGAVQSVTMTLPRAHTQHDITCADATIEEPALTPSGPLADVCLTDPPYFDFIAYDVLSQVFRAWQPDAALAGDPLHPDLSDPVATFGTRLGGAFTSASAQCRPGALLIFTYKGNAEAWEAVGMALDEAKRHVVALWPVLADPHMGHHASAGNCEYDMLVVTRPVTACEAVDAPITTADAWVTAFKNVRAVSDADYSNMSYALSMSAGRWGSVTS